MDLTVARILILVFATWVATAIGAALVVFIKKENAKLSRVVLGFAAGIMLVAAFFELLEPAAAYAEEIAGGLAWLIAAGSFLVGCAAIFGLDILLLRVRRRKSKDNDNGIQENIKYRKSLMLTSAIGLHNIPEGLAVGVLLGAVTYTYQLLAVLPVIIAIALHNLPEGTAVSLSFQNEKMGKWKSFLLGQVTGFIELISGIVGFLIVISFDVVVPFALGFAGGAMIWVVVHDLIPEVQENKKQSPYLATTAATIGMVIMIAVNVLLG